MFEALIILNKTYFKRLWNKKYITLKNLLNMKVYKTHIDSASFSFLEPTLRKLISKW